MVQISKATKEHWIEWEKEYGQVLGKERVRMKLVRFGKDVKRFLLFNRKYRFLDLYVMINSEKELQNFVDFIYEVEDYKDVKVSNLEIIHFISADKNQELYWKITDKMFENDNFMKIKIHDHNHFSRYYRNEEFSFYESYSKNLWDSQKGPNRFLFDEVSLDEVSLHVSQFKPEDFLKMKFKANKFELLLRTDKYEEFNIPSFFNNMKGHIKEFILSVSRVDLELN